MTQLLCRQAASSGRGAPTAPREISGDIVQCGSRGGAVLWRRGAGHREAVTGSPPGTRSYIARTLTPKPDRPRALDDRGQVAGPHGGSE